MLSHKYTQPQMPSRVVVLGARGFIGNAVCRQLDERGIAYLALGSADMDLTDPASKGRLAALLRPEDAVLMLAALTPDRGRDIGTFMRNLAMMQHLCAALEGSGCAHLTYFSSDAVFDPAVAQVSEQTPASPQDLYGVMHRAREIMAIGVARTPVLVLRPTLVYGANDTHNAYGPNRFRRAARREGKIALFGGGEETRDHIHVNDVAALTVNCLMHRSTGTLNLATGRSISFRDLARLVGAQFDTMPRIVESARANPITHRHYDITCLIKAFPRFRFTSLEEGIARVHQEAGAGVDG